MAVLVTAIHVLLYLGPRRGSPEQVRRWRLWVGQAQRNPLRRRISKRRGV